MSDFNKISAQYPRLPQRGILKAVAKSKSAPHNRNFKILIRIN